MLLIYLLIYTYSIFKRFLCRPTTGKERIFPHLSEEIDKANFDFSL